MSKMEYCDLLKNQILNMRNYLIGLFCVDSQNFPVCWIQLGVSMRRNINIRCLVSVLFISTDLHSQCTIFTLKKGKQVVYGQNMDWKNPLSSYVIVNKRGTKKHFTLERLLVCFKGRHTKSSDMDLQIRFSII